MPLFLDTRGLSSLGIGVCDRCRKTYPINDLSPDRNTPGLLVCDNGCNDDFDPWRLPARQTEDITLPHYRPDVPLGVQPDAPVAPTYRVTQDDVDLRDTDDDDYRILEVFP